MEHRYGTRREVRHRIELSWERGVHVLGTLRNVSISGALIAVEVPAPSSGPVEVKLVPRRTRSTRPRAVYLQGYVVRQVAAGLAIAWGELAPQALQALGRLYRPREPSSRMLSAADRP
jgi:hypothetical protein